MKATLTTLAAVIIAHFAFSQGSIDIDTNIQMGVVGTEHVKITSSAFSVHNGAGGTPLIYGDFVSGNVGIGTSSPGSKLQVNGTMESLSSTLHRAYHGKKLFIFGVGTSHSINLVNNFPDMYLTTGNGWAVFVKYCAIRVGGTVESREFTISRDSSGNWNAPSFSGNSTDGANLSTVTGSGSNITMHTLSGTYVNAEVTVMIR